MRYPDLPELTELFPALNSDNHAITSEAVSKYNCVAWAVGSTHHWWQAAHVRGYYWPPGVSTDHTLQSWIHAFQIHGYSLCSHGEHEPGWEKLAIYVLDDDDPQHVARQLRNGEWTSKLGELEDISHKTLDVLEGDGPEGYGRARHFLKKHRPDWVTNP